MRADVDPTADPRYPVVLAQQVVSCAYYCIIYTAIYNAYAAAPHGRPQQFH